MNKSKHGGSRPGAGRPATGKNTVSASISLAPELWGKLEKLKGEQSRSAWIAEKIKRARLKPNSHRSHSEAVNTRES